MKPIQKHQGAKKGQDRGLGGWSLALIGMVSLILVPCARAQTAPLSLSKGDRIVYVGNTLADRMQHQGWLETVIQSRFPEDELVFRNLGFSGDELSLRLRSEGFGGEPYTSIAGGWSSAKAPQKSDPVDPWLKFTRPTVIFAFFGYNESFAGPSGLEKFKSDLHKFVQDTIRYQFSGNSAPRLVLFSPIAHEDLQDPNLPDGKANNRNLELYTRAMAETAKAAKADGVIFVDLFTPTLALYGKSPKPWTINGIHLNVYGDQQLALVIEKALFGSAPTREEKRLEMIRQGVLDKDFYWFNRFRTVDGYSIFGGRADVSYVKGQSNRVVMQRELQVLDAMAANRDHRIWALAQGKDMKMDDSNTPDFLTVLTNKAGNGPNGAHLFLDGEEAINKMTVHKGMKVNLFASEKEFPLLQKPVQMAWDTKGRLWVAVWPTYPHGKPKEEWNDKLLILEDTDGDGKADKCTVFADHLHCPTGFEFYNGGVLVAQVPDILFLKDANNDGKADVSERVLMGMDSADTHHSANAFVLDPGGALYWQEGTFHHTQVETPYGPTVRSANAAVYRYEPRTQKFDVYVAYAFANPHGHVFDRWGEDFITDASGNENYYAAPFSGHVDFPNKHPDMQRFYPQRSRPAARTEILSSRHFPDELQGNLLIPNDIGFQGVFQYKITEKGSGFVGTEVEPLLSSSDSSFRPVDIQVGADGALYFLDWQNPIIGHVQHNLRDPSRDQTHGRIYRVSYPGRPLLKPPAIAGQPITKLLDLLKEPEDRVRYHAKIELGARETKSVMAELEKWIARLDKNDPEFQHHLMEALWVHQYHNVINEPLLKQMLRSPNPNARAAATRVLCYWRDRVANPMTLLKIQANDEHPRVRLEAIRACSFVPSAEAADVALETLKYPTDYYLDYVLRETMKTLAPQWKALATAGKPFAVGNPKGIEYVMKSVTTKELLAMEPNATVHTAILIRTDTSDEDHKKALMGLAQINKTTALTELLGLLEHTDGRVQTQLAALLPMWKPSELAGVRARLESVATTSAPPEVRHAGFAALIAADQSPDRAWQLASGSIHGLSDLLGAVPLVTAPAQRTALYPKIKPLLLELPAPLMAQVKPVKSTRGRFVRVELPGNGRTLTLAEVEVWGAGNNIARGGKASQSSTGYGGVPERAIDGNTSGIFGDGSQTHTNENETQPWWEVDLGTEQPIETITIWTRSEGGGTYAKRLDGFKLSVLSATRHPEFVRENNPGPEVKATFEVGESDPMASIRAAAITALRAIPDHDRETFEALADLILRGTDPIAASSAIGGIPRDQWPKDRAATLANAIVASVTKVPAEQRTSPEVEHTLQFGRDVATLLPATDAQTIRAALDNLTVQVIHLKSLPEMKYDKAELTVTAGRLVQIIFENKSEMPHNFVLVVPGAKEEIGLAVEKMNEDDLNLAAKKQYIPDSPKVLQFTKVIAPPNTIRVTFTAPVQPDDYPYLCTFPGHWRIMNGILHVVPAAAR